MRGVRFPIAGMMGVVLVVALGLAALRNASETWAGVTFLGTGAVLCLAVVGVVCRGEDERAWWLGFALFGWAYLGLAFWSSYELPTMALLDVIGSRLGVTVRFSGGMGGMGGGMRSADLQFTGMFRAADTGHAIQSIRQIAHCLWALLAALVGGTLASLLFGDRKGHSEELDNQTQGAGRTRWKWLMRWSAALGMGSCVAVVLLALFGTRSAPGFWAGATFLATCGLLGMTVLGAAGGKRASRHIWLGAALFGIGYMTVAFGRSADSPMWPSLPTDHFLNAGRQWFPAAVSGFPSSSRVVASANARIWEALERPVPMRFPHERPFEDILKYIKDATRGADGKDIPIYVDPIGLSEAGQTTGSVAAIDLEGVPLKTSLRLWLEQLDLTYNIRDGVLLITSIESAVIPIYQDPFLIAGHCLVALVAAELGAIVAPLVSSKRRATGARVAGVR